MNRGLKVGLSMVAIAIVGYQMVEVVYLLLEPWDFLNAHLTFALVLCYLWLLIQRQGNRAWLVTLLLVSVAATTYIYVNRPELEMRQGFPTTTDTVVGVALIACILDACWRTTGPAVPILSLCFIGYALIGDYLPGFLGTWAFPFPKVIAALTTNLTGVYGPLLEISAYYIFLFVVMGGILQVTAASRFFNIMGSLAARIRGGPAMSSVITSALVGTTLGSTDANVALTGSFTIPLMKRSGYAPHQAGAIESAASNGGMIMPPIMGAAAFVMADFIGVLYFTVVAAAVVPAILYFVCVALYVYLTARKMDIQPVRVSMDKRMVKELLVTAPGFVSPLILMTYLLANGFSPRYAAFWGVVTVIAIGLITPGKRPTWGEWVEGFTNGALTGATIAISIVSVAMVVEMLTLTGLAFKLPGLVDAWSQGSLPMALVITAIACLVLGMGVPPTPAYLVVAITAAPVIVRLGVPLLNAHLFVFYFAVMSMVTPPVAPAAVVGARLAGASYLRTALEAAKVAAAGFLVPFLFVASPIFILRPEVTTLSWILTSVTAGFLMLLCIQAGLVGYFITALSLAEKLLCLVAGVSFFMYLLLKGTYMPFILGTGCLLALLVRQITRSQALRVLMRRSSISSKSRSS